MATNFKSNQSFSFVFGYIINKLCAHSTCYLNEDILNIKHFNTHTHTLAQLGVISFFMAIIFEDNDQATAASSTDNVNFLDQHPRQKWSENLLERCRHPSYATNLPYPFQKSLHQKLNIPNAHIDK